jgi:hypothetical protein
MMVVMPTATLPVLQTVRSLPFAQIEAEYLRTRDPVWLWAAARHITLTRLADVFDNKTLQCMAIPVLKLD